MTTVDLTKTPFPPVLPFLAAFTLVPVVLWSVWMGGWWVLSVAVYAWVFFALADGIVGENTQNADPDTPRSALKWHRLITLLWAPVQAVLLFGLIYYVTRMGNLSTAEMIGLFFGVGVLTGTVGIVYSHELMHQRPRLDRSLADGLLAMVLYSHFRSEHLLVHHRYVGTPKDPVTARYNEGFHRYFPRVLIGCARSSFLAETAMLARKGLSPWHVSNPFWRYAVLQLLCLAAAFVLGGWLGVGLFAFQACVAIWQLELVNYVEHYGLTRKHLGNGKYEHAKPHHSWNGAQMASNWLLINLQRHSDHHFKPDRPFPLLQTYSADEAPCLPHGYAVMTAMAMVPPLWRRVMNPKVRAWRARHYPEIEDWSPYREASNPMPGAH